MTSDGVPANQLWAQVSASTCIAIPAASGPFPFASSTVLSTRFPFGRQIRRYLFRYSLVQPLFSA